MSKVFEQIGFMGRREDLVVITNTFDPSVLAKILGNKKTSNFEEHELLAYVYALALAKIITDNVGVRVTPYASKSDSYCGERRDHLRLHLIEGGNGRHTQYNGVGMLELSIDLANKKILRNDLQFYECRKIFSSEKTLYDIVKSVSDDFAKAADLKLVGYAKEQIIENRLRYEHRKNN